MVKIGEENYQQLLFAHRHEWAIDFLQVLRDGSLHYHWMNPTSCYAFDFVQKAWCNVM